MRKLLAVALAALLIPATALAQVQINRSQTGRVGAIVTATDPSGNTGRVIMPGSVLYDSSGTEKGTSANPLATSGDGVNDNAVTTASVTAAGNVVATSTKGAAGGSFQVTSAGAGNTLTFEQSNDSTTGADGTWVNLTTYSVGNNSVLVPAQTAAAVGLYAFTTNAAWVRARVSTYGSGTVTVTAVLKRSVVPQGQAVTGLSGNGLTVQGAAGGNALPTWNVAPSNSITAASGNVANASAAATLAGVSGKTTTITGFQCTAAGATAASVVNLTVAGVITGTMTYTFVFPAGATVAAAPLTVAFPNPVPASATNTAIVVTLPAGGAGNTNAACAAQGYQL